MEDEACMVEDIIKMLGKKHMLIILRSFYEKNPLRFNELMKQIDVSPKTLSDRLKELREMGIVNREPKAEIPPRVDYTLTKKGLELMQVFEPLTEWTSKYYQ